MYIYPSKDLQTSLARREYNAQEISAIGGCRHSGEDNIAHIKQIKYRAFARLYIFHFYFMCYYNDCETS